MKKNMFEVYIGDSDEALSSLLLEIKNLFSKEENKKVILENNLFKGPCRGLSVYKEVPERVFNQALEDFIQKIFSFEILYFQEFNRVWVILPVGVSPEYAYGLEEVNETDYSKLVSNIKEKVLGEIKSQFPYTTLEEFNKELDKFKYLKISVLNDIQLETIKSQFLKMVADSLINSLRTGETTLESLKELYPSRVCEIVEKIIKAVGEQGLI